MAISSTSFGALLYRFPSTSRRDVGNSIGTLCAFTQLPRGSALECAAILDALEAMGAVFDDANLREGRELLERIVSMLTGLI